MVIIRSLMALILLLGFTALAVWAIVFFSALLIPIVIGGTAVFFLAVLIGVISGLFKRGQQQ